MSAWIPELSQEDSDDIGLFTSVYKDVDLTTLLVLVENIRHRAWAEASARAGRTVEPDDVPFDMERGQEYLERARALVWRFGDDDESLAHAIAVMAAAEVYKALREAQR